MYHNRYTISTWLLLISLVITPVLWAGETIPRPLLGKIITNKREIKIPTEDFVKRLYQQDSKTFSNQEGQWIIHFVAFFNRPLPSKQIGLVVLDAKGDVAALAQIAGHPGQRTLASRLAIDSTPSPGEKHTFQLFYQKAGKPVMLAKKQIILH